MSLEDFRPMMERCSNCLGCRWIPFDKVQSQRFGEGCPSIAYHHFMTYSARGRFQLSQSLLDKRAECTDKVTGVIHNCMACGACDVSCKICRYNLEPLEHNLALKEWAVKNGAVLPKQKELVKNLREKNTMLDDASNTANRDWIKDYGFKDLNSQTAEILFFPGCKYSYDAALSESAAASAKLMCQTGADIGVFGENMCCAGRAFQMGFTGEFEDAAGENIERIRKSGIKTIVTPCSDCYHSFKRLYAKMGLEIEVLHTVEYFAKAIGEGKLKLINEVPLTVTYHDPCHLGRQGEAYIPWEGKEKKILNQVHTWDPRRPRYNGAEGIYDAPREVIKSIPGITFIEMERIREYSFCCGAGGGCSETNPEFSAWTAKQRVDEAKSTGAEVIITACPWCKTNLGGTGEKPVRVLDICDLIQMAVKGGA